MLSGVFVAFSVCQRAAVTSTGKMASQITGSRGVGVGGGAINSIRSFWSS